MAWGSNSTGQTSVPAGIHDVKVTQVAAGWDHSLALTAGGRVFAWGGVHQAQQEVPSALEGARVLQVAAGYNRTLALTRYQGPDLWVGPARYAHFDGNNAYVTRGPVDLGGSWVTYVWWGPKVHRYFNVRVYNDGSTLRTFRVRATPPKVATRARFYNARGRDLTRSLESAAGLTVEIRPHHYRLFTMRLDLGPWRLVTSTTGGLSATWVGHPRHVDRVEGTIVFVD